MVLASARSPTARAKTYMMFAGVGSKHHDRVAGVHRQVKQGAAWRGRALGIDEYASRHDYERFLA